MQPRIAFPWYSNETDRAWLAWGLAFMLALVLTAPCWAQRGGGPDRRGLGNGPHQSEARELLEQVLIARVSDELALDDTQTVLLVRRFTEYRERMRDLRRERRELEMELREAVNAELEEPGIQSKLDALMLHDDELLQAERTMLDEVGAGLTAWQRAKLYLFLADFENEMRRLVMRAQQRGGMRGGAAPPERGSRGMRHRSEDSAPREAPTLPEEAQDPGNANGKSDSAG